jgi:transitional endoplasmic reticulum ATPase
VSVADEGRCIHFELRDRRVGVVTSTNQIDYEVHVGDIALLMEGGEQEPSLEPAPAGIWVSDPWIGVVRMRLADITAVDTGGRIQRVPTSAVDYEPGNTVEADDLRGVLRVLSRDPIKFLDLSEPVDLDRFRSPAGAATLSFSDFGGLPDVVNRVRELIALPLNKHSELQAIGGRPIKGVLFTGDPGTGKTMLARIVATEAGAAFYEIRGPEIFSKWYGQSGEVLRAIFDRAANDPSAIIFFDEIDSVAPRRSDYSHEESKRVVAQLLTLMDGFKPDDNVVVIATTNRPDDIDPALRRPGRFDWEIHFRMPTQSDREAILEAAARRIRQSGPMPHRAIAANTEGWSGADLAAIWTEATHLAVGDGREQVLAEDYVGGFERVTRQREEKNRLARLQ